MVLVYLHQGLACTETILLVPCLSPSYPLCLALQKVQGQLWNFWSPLELPLLGAGTFLFGTSDGRHSISGGLCGFYPPRGSPREVKDLYRTRLRHCRYALRVLRQIHLRGHFGG